jgi:5'-nucleotidase
MTVRLRRGLATAFAATLTAALAFTPGGAAAAAKPPSTIPVQLLAINDFHGNLEPPSGSSGTVTRLNPDGTTTPLTVGGAEYLSTALKAARAGHNSVTVSAGDNEGASPLLSAAFHDEPTFLALHEMGVDVSSVGNHEFDEGKDELKRIEYGGCRADDGCYDPAHPYPGAGFPYLAANVIDDSTHLPLLPPVWVKNVGGALVGFIGVTLQGTPQIVTADGVKGLTFTAEVSTINFYAKLLHLAGINAIVALIHQGGIPTTAPYNADCDANGPGAGLTGDIVPIAQQLDPAVDIIVSGHTHTSYVCDIPDPAGQPRLVTSAASFGRLYTDFEAQYDKRTHDFVRSSITAHNVPVLRTVAPDPAITSIITQYKTLLGPIANRVVGHISADILGRGATTPEEPLGDVIADAQLEATTDVEDGGAVMAFMNPGGIRGDLVYAHSGTEADGEVTYAEAFTVQPFNNLVETITLTGAQILTALQEQYTGANATAPKVLQVSAGFTYILDLTKTGADRIVADSLKLGGTPIDPAASYRVTVNNFLAGGGDNFTILKSGTDPHVGAVDIDAFTAWLMDHTSAASPLAPPPADRITIIH